MPGPVCSAACSVASPISQASGMSASGGEHELGGLGEVREVVEARSRAARGRASRRGSCGPRARTLSGPVAPERVADSVGTRAASPLPENRRLSSLAAGAPGEHNRLMNEAAAEVGIPLRVQDEVECRHCAVHCEKVVYPGACIRMACPFVYAYEAWGRTYMGCLQKVFDVEIDLVAARGRRGGAGRLRRGPRPPGAAADVRRRGRRVLRRPRGRARLPEPRVPRAPARARDVPRLRDASTTRR